MNQSDLELLGFELKEEDIKAFERRLDIRLPEDYREFLARTNGGSVPVRNGYYFISNVNWWIHVDFFFGIRRPDVDVYEIESVLGRLREQYPEHFYRDAGKLPIASDDFGNKIYILLTGHERGAVYFWMHDAEDQDDKLGSSFHSFLESLGPGPPETLHNVVGA